MENTTESYVEIIEKAIGKIGLDPESTRTQRTGVWTLQKGSSKIFIELFQVAQNSPFYFGVTSPIMKLPQSNLETFLKDIFQLNHMMVGAAFSLQKDVIFIRFNRPIKGMDEEEAFDMIMTVGEAADHYDNILQEKYPFREPIGFKTNQQEEDN
ncbi:MAG: YbjN domain-containing protein [Bacteroidota bacterium]